MPAVFPVNAPNPNLAYPSALSGYPTYSGVFIPQIWSTNLVKKYYDGTVLTQITNTDYEGEIRNHGDTVIIRTQPTVTMRNYEMGLPLETEFPTGGRMELLIDKGLYWSCGIDDVVAKQQDVRQMEMWSTDASEQMKIAIDSEVLAYLPANVHARNGGATAGRVSQNINLGTAADAIAVNKDNIVELILRLGQVLDEQNVPETGRFLVMPFSSTTLAKLSDLKAVHVTGDGKSPLRNGMVGVIDRFTVFNSNLLPINNAATGTQSRGIILAGHKDAATFATQLTKTETIRAERTFGDIMRGLIVYGYRMIKPEAMAVARIR